MKKSVVLFVILICAHFAAGQRMSLVKGTISFFSKAPIEDISAVTTKATSLYDPETGHIAFSIPIHTFEFPKKLMQEHFNEKYMESDKFPDAFFSGAIGNLSKDKIGIQQVTASGKLTVHGVTREVEVPGTMELKDGIVLMRAEFIIRLEDYKVEIPELLWQNIAESVKVSIDLVYKQE